MTWEELLEKLKELTFTPEEIYTWMERLEKLKSAENESNR